MNNIPHKPIGEPDNDADDLEFLAMNIVHQIGDALYEALPPDVAHDHFVTARQATNDVAISFAKKLIDNYCQAREKREADCTHSTPSANDLLMCPSCGETFPLKKAQNVKALKQAEMIKALQAQGYGLREIGRLFGMHPQTVKNIAAKLSAPAQPQPLNDGELRIKVKRDLQTLKGDDGQYVLSNLASTYGLPALVEYITQAIASHSPSTEAAVLDALISEYKKNRRWFERMAEYADVKQDAMDEYDDRIAELEKERTALESVTTDEGDV